MDYPIINLEARGLLPLQKLPFTNKPMKITVMDRIGQEFDAVAIRDEVSVIAISPTDGDIIGWKMRI